MSYNIDTWTTVQCTLTAHANALDSAYLTDVTYGKPDAQGTIIDLSFDLGCETIAGTLINDVIVLSEFQVYGEGSGRTLDTIRKWLAKTRGILEAVLVWEGGDSITHFRCVDGIVTNDTLDIAALLHEVIQLRASASDDPPAAPEQP